MSITLVSTVTVGSGGAASIDFTSIPQTGTDLFLVFSLRSSDASQSIVTFRINGSNPSAGIYLRGTGSAAQTTNGYVSLGAINLSTTTANTFSNSQVYLPNYTSTTNKTYSADTVFETNATAAQQYIIAGSQTSTVAITSLALSLPGSVNFAQHSTASLYIVTKGSGGATTSP
jgi:hypothetical protein